MLNMHRSDPSNVRMHDWCSMFLKYMRIFIFIYKNIIRSDNLQLNMHRSEISDVRMHDCSSMLLKYIQIFCLPYRYNPDKYAGDDDYLSDMEADFRTIQVEDNRR